MRTPGLAAQATPGTPASPPDIDLVAMLAHDIRNHLTPMRGRVRFIRRRAESDGRAADVADAAALDESIGQLARLVAEVLEAARLGRNLLVLDMQPFDALALARSVARTMQTPDVAVQVRGQEREVGLVGDPHRIRQALENLVANAVRHGGSQVLVDVTSALRDDGVWVSIRVEDRGPGILPELLPTLLEPFTHGPASGGLGLGLHLVNAIALAHGGYVGVESPPGGGARFTLHLPAATTTTDIPAV